MSLPREEKQIVLTLTNTSAYNSSTVSLFSFPTDLDSASTVGGATASGQETAVKNSNFAGGTWRFFYNGGSDFFNAGVQTSIDTLLTTLNDEFGNIFWKEADPINNWMLRVASLEYIFTQITVTALPTKVFTSLGSNYISGSSVAATLGYSNVTYDSITSELTNQPYLITTVYISTSNLTQAQNPFSVNRLDQNGVAETRPVQPLISPDQSQNINIAIPIYQVTSALNQVQYTLEASASVLMVVRYENIDLFDAGKLMESDKFKKEMALLKAQDEEQYKRAIETLDSYQDVAFVSEPVDKKDNKKQNQTFAVPLFYVIAFYNGNKNVKML
jgi:hypothetical protein